MFKCILLSLKVIISSNECQFFLLIISITHPKHCERLTAGKPMTGRNALSKKPDLIFPGQ